MLTRRRLFASILGLAATPLLAACGQRDPNTLTVAAAPEPHAIILNEFAAPRLAERGYKLDVMEFTDYMQPNIVVYHGELDCNYFQHANYLRDFCEETGEELTIVDKIHYEPFGIYAGTSHDLANLAEGATIGVPNDPTNEARALLLLQQEGLIRLKDPKDLHATPNDIVENPHKLSFREIEAAATPRALEDVDFAAINGNYAIQADLHASDALVLEEASGVAFDEYANIIATSTDKAEDPRILALVEVLKTDEFKVFLQEHFGQDVLPAF